MKYACLLCLTTPPTVPSDVPRACSVKELNEIRFSAQADGLFVTTGTVQSAHADPHQAPVVLEDDGRRTKVFMSPTLPLPRVGDRIAVTCRKLIKSDHDKILAVRALETVGKGPVSPPLRIRLGELDDRRYDLFTVITEGTVVDILPDEVDARYCIWLLKDGAAQIPMFVRTTVSTDGQIGARLRVTADFERQLGGQRRFPRPCLVAGAPNFEMLAPPADPFDAPPLDPGDYLTAQEVRTMDRRTLEGFVLATWNGNSIMLRVGNVVAHVRLRHEHTLPAAGSRIRASGYPDTDLYRIILTDAVWQKSSAATTAPTDDEPIIRSIAQVVHSVGAQREITGQAHGTLLRLKGTVKSFSPAKRTIRRFVLETDGESVPVDFGSCPEIEERLQTGCTVEVTGRCLLSVDSDKGHLGFPQISGVSLLLRTADDLRILSTPSWWTPQRLFALIILLIILLTGIAIWNRFLNHIVTRRGRQLYRADIARASEALRVEERTRLAIELHDSLSQNLTGIALQINAGRNKLAAQALKSCREDLRNCLWDLRNNAIDCASMDEAIRQTLAPHVEDVALSVRFNVPRRVLSDNTAYAIIRIVRELVTNAIRHGHAANVHVAGSLGTDRLLFSVRDDGSGFDPASRPGVDEGHFGLQGVCERVTSLGGDVTIDSAVGRGAKIIVTIPISKNSEHTRKWTRHAS